MYIKLEFNTNAVTELSEYDMKRIGDFIFALSVLSDELSTPRAAFEALAKFNRFAVVATTCRIVEF